MRPKNDSVFSKAFKTILVCDVMTNNPVTIYEKEELSVIAEVLIHKKIRHLPIIDSKHKLVGLVSKRDVYRTVAPRKRIDECNTVEKGKII
ncbi:MAG: CBS domain-containing protein [Candidatus Omnitrophota bacterium]|jgi:CBS domain-containing protein